MFSRNEFLGTVLLAPLAGLFGLKEPKDEVDIEIVIPTTNITGGDKWQEPFVVINGKRYYNFEVTWRSEFGTKVGQDLTHEP